MKKFLMVICILFLIVGTGVIAYMAYEVFQSQTKQEQEEPRKEDLTDVAPVMYYKDPKQNGATVILQDNEIFKYQVVMKYAGKSITMKRNGKVVEYKEEKLEDGEYEVVVTGKGDDFVRHFIVDVTPPKITNIRAGKYTEAQTVIFEDVQDVAKATLTNKQTNKVIDIKEYLEKNETDKYTIPYEKGSYLLEVEDKYGHGIMPLTIVYE
ncbi:MAG: hypothetical protein HFJ27_00305 [Clostridia bacterium]|nr:hypothetical protein [Clostridia bacterium]